MWIVKLGGSLCSDPLLPEWLDLFAQLGGGRVTLVSGGGRFADEVRRAQAQWQLDDVTAHNMALMAMVQMAYQFHGLHPSLQLAASKAELHRVLHRGQTAMWLPFELQRDRPDRTTNWDFTSDSIALELARRLNAERLVLVKACAIDPALSLAQLGAVGVVDASFAALADGISFPIDLLHKSELARARALLLGEHRTLAS